MTDDERRNDDELGNSLNNGMNQLANIGQNAVQNSIPKAAKEGGKQAASAAAKEGVKEGSKAAASAAAGASSAAAGAASGGATYVAQKALEAGATIGKLGDVNDPMKSGTESKLTMVVIGLVVFLLLSSSSTTPTHYFMASPSEVYIENQYQAVEASGERAEDAEGGFGGFFKKILNFFIAIFEFVGYDYQTPARYDVVYEDSLLSNVDIIKKGATKAFEVVAPKEVQYVIKDKKYDYDLTWASWLKCKNPFLTEEGEWNINFAEFLSIINESQLFKANELLPVDYQAYMDNEEKLQYLYYLEFEEMWRFYESYSVWEDHVLYNEDGSSYIKREEVYKENTYDVPAGTSTLTTEYGTYTLTEDNTTLWAKVHIYKYDLLDLCDMFEVDLYGTYLYSGDEYTAATSNLEMYIQTDSYSSYLMAEDEGLSYQDLMIYGFAKDIDLGPREKTPLERHIHNGLIDYDYGVPEDGEVPEYKPDDLESISESIKYLLEWLHSKVGSPYSQDLRDDGVHFDCSSLVYYAYKQIGMNVSYKGSTTAASIAMGMEASSKTVSSSNLQPGDLIFYSHENNGRYKNITHVAIYVGDGKVIDARGKKYGVVYRDLPTKNIVMCARPMS